MLYKKLINTKKALKKNLKKKGQTALPISSLYLGVNNMIGEALLNVLDYYRHIITLIESATSG